MLLFKTLFKVFGIGKVSLSGYLFKLMAADLPRPVILAVIIGGSANIQDLIGIFGLKLPEALSRAPFDFDAKLGKWVTTGTLFDSPAVVVTALVTVILVIGIKESASFNAAVVILKLAIVLMVIGVGVFYVDANNWHPFSPYGLTGVSFFGKTLFGQTDAAGQPVGMLAGGAPIFFAYIGFDSVSTHSEEARNPQRDVPIGIITSLVLCRVMARRLAHEISKHGISLAGSPVTETETIVDQ